MVKIIFSFIILFITLEGCSTNEKIVVDNRREINNAIKWDPEFIPNDTSSGIKLEFVPPIIHSGKNYFAVWSASNWTPLSYTYITLWAYPIDTIVHIRKDYNCPQPMPSGRMADYTNINYEIKNNPIKMRSNVEPDKATFIRIPAGTYLMQWEVAGYVTRWIKDLSIKPNYWSITKIDTVHTFVPTY